MVGLFPAKVLDLNGVPALGTGVHPDHEVGVLHLRVPGSDPRSETGRGSVPSWNQTESRTWVHFSGTWSNPRCCRNLAPLSDNTAVVVAVVVVVVVVVDFQVRDGVPTGGNFARFSGHAKSPAISDFPI